MATNGWVAHVLGLSEKTDFRTKHIQLSQEMIAMTSKFASPFLNAALFFQL